MIKNLRSLFPVFLFAFFIAGHDHLKDVLMDVYEEVLSHSGRVKFAKEQNGMYFATLKEVQKRGVHAKFSSFQDTLTFADLAD